MTETDFEGPDYDPAFDAEHDVDQDEPAPDVPVEADPADVEEQHREVPDTGDEEYR
jgi:hypothetical protein